MHYRSMVPVIALAFVVSSAQAHVRVQPVESQPGAKQVYTVRVPTEGKVTTTSVVLEVPAGVSIVSAEGQAELTKQGEKTVAITWKAEIPPGQSQVFTFEANNPVTGREIVWKAHQHYADGTSRDWADEPTSKSPASVTRLGGAAN